MLDSIEELPRVGHLGKLAVEVAGPRQPLPEFTAPVPVFEGRRSHSENALRASVEVRKHPVAVEEEMRLSLHHLNFVGSRSMGTGRSSTCHLCSRRTSLLSFAPRPGPSDQVI